MQHTHSDLTQGVPAQLETGTVVTAEATSRNMVASHVLGAVRRLVRENFVYPPFARRQGWQGEVLVAIEFGPEGDIRSTQVLRSSGYRILDQDALLILHKIGAIPDARPWIGGRNYQAHIPIIYRLTS